MVFNVTRVFCKKYSCGVAREGDVESKSVCSKHQGGTAAAWPGSTGACEAGMWGLEKHW